MRYYTLLFIVLMSLSVCPAVFASGDGDTEYQPVTVSIDELLEIEYTGDYTLEFNLTEEDICAGRLVLHNQGDINWYASIEPWKVVVNRTEWEPYVNFRLQVRHDNYCFGNWWWRTVHTYDTVWLYGDETGEGTLDGIDWKIRNLGCEPEPGLYVTTVTITIAPDS